MSRRRPSRSRHPTLGAEQDAPRPLPLEVSPSCADAGPKTHPPFTTSSIHKDGREGEHGHHHAPPARPWRGVGMILTLIKTAFITAKTHPPVADLRPGFTDGYLLVTGWGARARSRTFVSTGPALPSGRRPSPQRISGFVPVADPGSFAPRPIPASLPSQIPGLSSPGQYRFADLWAGRRKARDCLPWLSHSSEAPASGSRCSANSAVPARR